MSRLDRKAVEGNFLDRIEALEKRIKALEMAQARVNALNEISGDLGVVTSGEFRAQDENGNVRMVMSSNDQGVLSEFGVEAHLAGIDKNRRVQFWVDADDGSIRAAGGDIILDGKGGMFSGRPLRLAASSQQGQYGYSVEAYVGGIQTSGDAVEGWNKPVGGVVMGVTDYISDTEICPDPNMTNQTLWLSAITGGSGAFDENGRLVLTNAELNMMTVFAGPTSSTANDRYIGNSVYLLEIVGIGSLGVHIEMSYGINKSRVYVSRVYSVNDTLRLLIPIDDFSSSGGVFLLTGNGTFSRISFLALNSGMLWIQRGVGSIIWNGSLSNCVLVERFVGGAATTGNIGNLGWLLPAGSIAAMNPGPGITLSSTTTSGTIGRLVLGTAGTLVKQHCRRLAFRIRPGTTFSTAGNIAVGFWNVVPGAATPVYSDGVFAFADRTDGLGYWKVTDTSGINTTTIPVNTGTTYDIEFRQVQKSNWVIYINGTLVGRVDSGISIGYIMARAYTGNSTAKTLNLLGFIGWMDEGFAY